MGLSNYGTKANLKNATGIDNSKLAPKSNLANLKAEIYQAYVDKLKTVPIDLSKLINIVNNDVVKKILYDEIVSKVNKIDAGGVVLKTKYEKDKSDLEKKIGDTDKKS